MAYQADHATFAGVLADVVEGLRPPRRMRISEAAQQVVRLSLPGGYAGPWSPDLTPYMVEPMDLLASRQHEAVVFCGPARTGKTQSLLDCWLGYIVTCDPGDSGFYFPTEELAADYSKRRVDRLHRGSPEVGGWLSPRGHDDNIHLKRYRHGMMLSLLWPSSAQMAQRDLRYVALSDYDAMPADIGGEGEGFALAKKRITTYMSGGMALAESSPRHAITDPRWKAETPHQAPPVEAGILQLYNRGDRRRWYWSCLHCGEPFEAPALPSFQDLPDPVEASRTAYVPCPHCGAIHSQEDRRALNAGGQWKRDQRDGKPVDSTIASFWLLGCAAAFQPWHSLALNWIRAERSYRETGSEESLRTTTQQDQGLPYLPRRLAASRKATDLQARAEPIDRAVVPDGVRFLTAAVDVQARRFVAQVEGHGVDGERWVIDRFDLFQSPRGDHAGDPLQVEPAAYLEDWALLREVIGRTYPLADGTGRQMPLMLLGVDTGGLEGVTARAYDWYRLMRRAGLVRRLRLLKGDPKIASITETLPDTAKRRDGLRRGAGGRGDVPVFLLPVTELKDRLFANLDREEPGPGYIHLSRWLDDTWFGELLAEVRGPKGYERVSQRNESLDLMVYNSALAMMLGKIDWQNPPAWAQAWDTNSTLAEKPAAKESAKRVQPLLPKRGNFSPRRW
jgi:phage terminase large subunit GpA-like protein